MQNCEIREAIRKSRFYQYEIANELGITEYALCRWLRYELTDDQKQRILDAISSLRAKAASEADE